ncbi:MAG: Flp family type IVb pilin [Alsobacter sp.]
MARSTAPACCPGRAGLVRRFLGCESAATAIEYGLMAAIFSVTVIGASGSVRSALQAVFTTVTSAVAANSNG